MGVSIASQYAREMLDCNPAVPHSWYKGSSTRANRNHSKEIGKPHQIQTIRQPGRDLFGCCKTGVNLPSIYLMADGDGLYIHQDPITAYGLVARHTSCLMLCPVCSLHRGSGTIDKSGSLSGKNIPSPYCC